MPGSKPSRPGEPPSGDPQGDATGSGDAAAEGAQRALMLAYRAISRRERTESELRAFLERRGEAPEAIEVALEDLRGSGCVDDAVYARRFAEDRRLLDRWGPERIQRELARRGVHEELIDGALSERGPEQELEAALALLAERFGAGLEDDRARARAWSLLVRRGHAEEVAYAAVREHERAPGDRLH